MNKRLKEFGISLLAVLALAGIASAQKWARSEKSTYFSSGRKLRCLRTAPCYFHEEQDSTPQKWYKLTPDDTGSYINGKNHGPLLRCPARTVRLLRFRSVARRPDIIEGANTTITARGLLG